MISGVARCLKEKFSVVGPDVASRIPYAPCYEEDKHARHNEGIKENQKALGNGKLLLLVSFVGKRIFLAFGLTHRENDNRNNCQAYRKMRREKKMCYVVATLPDPTKPLLQIAYLKSPMAKYPSVHNPLKVSYSDHLYYIRLFAQVNV